MVLDMGCLMFIFLWIDGLRCCVVFFSSSFFSLLQNSLYDAFAIVYGCSLISLLLKSPNLATGLLHPVSGMTVDIGLDLRATQRNTLHSLNGDSLLRLK